MSARKATKGGQGTTVQQDEAYWNQSSFKPFNFDDDDDEESIDTIEWNGATAAPVRPEAMQAQKARPVMPASRATSARAFNARKTVTPVSNTSQSVNYSARGGTVNSGILSSTENHKTITEIVKSKDTYTTMDIAKLETEINSLRRQLNQARRDRAQAPSRTETLKRMMLGDPAVLELYRSIEDKKALLDDAIRRHDGNAILATTLFMRNSLKRELFSKELMSRPVAVDHYCSYLRLTSENEELHEILTVLGRTEEAAMLKYRHCLHSSRSPEVRTNGLKDCIKYYFDSDPRLLNETREIQDQASLLERQIIIDENDRKTQESDKPSVFKTHPRRDSLVNKSLVTTLYYCSYYHWGETEGILSSPLSLRTDYKVGEKQFIYMGIAALCRMRKWRDLEQLLTTPKSLFRSARLYAVIGFDKVVDVLSKNLAPPDAILKYCTEIENSETRLQAAVRHKCHKVAVDTLVHMKDRQQLMAYLNQIPDSNQHMRQYLLSMTKKQDIKWRN